MILLIQTSCCCLRIREVIDEDVLHARVPFVAHTQQCFVVKAGIDRLLDIARRSFCDTSEAMHTLANKYREDFKFPNLKLTFNNRQGFYFNIPQKSIQEKLLSKFIQVLKHGNNIHCSTLELASLNVRNNSAATECYIRTEVCLEGAYILMQEKKMSNAAKHLVGHMGNPLIGLLANMTLIICKLHNYRRRFIKLL